MIASIDSSKCTGCGSCVRQCTLDVFSLDTDQPRVAPCMVRCPCGVDIRGIMYLIQQDKREEALALLKKNLPFPALTSRLCGHPCEGACIRAGDEALDICGIERWLGALDLRESAARIPQRHLAQTAVVGAGLAGLSCAAFLCMHGYPVTLYEASSGVGGSLKSRVAQGMPALLLDYCETRLRDMGVNFCFNTMIGEDGDLPLDDLFDRGVRSVCLATGGGLAGFPQTGKKAEFPLQYGATGDPRIVIAGGCLGASCAEEATMQARQAAMSMHAYLNGSDVSLELPFPAVSDRLPPALPARPRAADTRADSWTDVMNLEEVQIESGRCLTCGSRAFISHPDDCMTCFTCEMACPVHAISVHPFKEVLPRSLEN